MMRPRLSEHVAREVHQRALRENRSFSNMCETMLKAALQAGEQTRQPDVKLINREAD
jgi:hypothetical protein